MSKRAAQLLRGLDKAATEGPWGTFDAHLASRPEGEVRRG